MAKFKKGDRVRVVHSDCTRDILAGACGTVDEDGSPVPWVTMDAGRRVALGEWRLELIDEPSGVASPRNGPVMSAAECLNTAATLVSGDRDRQHGAKADNFGRIAIMWQAWLETRRDSSAPLTGHDVAVMMTAMKLARTQSGEHNPDDYVDACGYAACAGELAS